MAFIQGQNRTQNQFAWLHSQKQKLIQKCDTSDMLVDMVVNILVKTYHQHLTDTQPRCDYETLADSWSLYQPTIS